MSTGHRDAANEVSRQPFEAARTFRLLRLPELYCGFGRDIARDEPAEYPVSCSPQAWAAGTPYLLVQSMLGLEANALERRLTVNPHLPEWLGPVEVRRLRVGEGLVDFRVHDGEVRVLSSDGVEVRAVAGNRYPTIVPSQTWHI